MSEQTFIGLDVHARSVRAALLDGLTGEVRNLEAPVPTARLVQWICAQPAPQAVAYEAGPTGYVLARALKQAGVRCTVAAPSRILRAPGERVKTDRRDALKLARLLRLEELVAVRVPDLIEEAARDLVRAREDARIDLMRARHRLSKLLLRRGIVWQQATWSAAHERFLRRQRFAEAPLQLAYGEALATMFAARDRRDALEAAIAQEAAKEPWAAVVARLCCLRGISTLTAFALAAEIGDWRRFSGRGLAAFLGLVPSEESSGESRRLGAITRTGNGHLRRLLIEAAWQQRRAPGAGLRVRQARVAAPAAVRERARLCERRLHRRWRRFDERGKRANVAAVAVARELAGWCWSVALMDEQRPPEIGGDEASAPDRGREHPRACY
jgi:transposase